MVGLRKWLCGISSLAFLGCGAQDLIENPMVDRWCGERPCAWHVSGKVKRVGTWHTDDYAVELLGSNTTLSQVNENVNARDAECLGFTMIADVDSKTSLFVELDFLDDGHVDFSQRIPESHWKRRTFLVLAPSWYEGVRFIVRKSGAGRAVLAELRAGEESDCRGPAVKLKGRPDGVVCEQDDDCKSEKCAFGSCSFCRGDEECAEGEVCGIASDGETFAERCVKPGSARFGESCSSDAQCGNGICCEGACSECCAEAAPCADGLTCATPTITGDLAKINTLPRPHRCMREPGTAPEGALCFGEGECQSGVCSGFGIDCATVDPWDRDAAIDELDPSALFKCPNWRVREGTCD